MKNLLFLLAIVAGCQGTTPRPHPATPSDTDDCEPACEALRVHKCAEGDNLPPSEDHPEGATCEQFCHETQDSGHSLKPSCVKKITSCSQMQTIQNSDVCPIP